MMLTHLVGNTYVLEGAALMGVYKLDDTRCVLIDSGEEYEGEELVATLKEAGLTPVGVMATHMHRDHAINHPLLCRTFGCSVAVPEWELHLTHTPVGLKGYFYCFSPGQLSKRLGNMVWPVDCPIPSEDGTFSFCGADFSILHTPGHSLDHVCITTPDGVCFVGDALFCGPMLEAKLPYGLYLAQMLDSARKVPKANARLYVIAHRGMCTDIIPCVHATCELIEGRAAEIAALIDSPITWETVWRRVNAHFSLLSHRVERAAMMERNLRSFVDYLVDRGDVTLSAQEGMVYLAPAGQVQMNNEE